MKNLHIPTRSLLIFIGMFILAAVSCKKEPVQQPPADEPEDVFTEAVPDIPDYVNANLVYMGDDTYSGISDGWILSLYTDMELDPAGNPIGEGQLVQILLNTTYNESQTPDPELLSGIYKAQASTGDLSAGTFCDGYMMTIDLPGQGRIEMPDGTFFGDIPEGETTFEPDLLREGYCQIEVKDDGTFAIDGIMVGTMFQKRYFSYEGPVDIVNRAEVVLPNSTLAADADLSGLFVKGVLHDKGDYFFLQDESYRLFVLLLAEESVDLSTEFAAGDGQYIRLEMFVPWDSVPEDGIPEGTYTVVERSDNGGIMKSDIAPFNMPGGQKDKFTYPSGVWYQTLSEGVVVPDYARIVSGTMEVRRRGDAHDIAIEFEDCSTPSHKVTCSWSTDTAIPVLD